MRWRSEEKLRRALPYGMWKWRDQDGQVIETIFNRRYAAIATKVNGQVVIEVVWPPHRMRAAEYFFGFGDNSSMEGCPWETLSPSRAKAVRQRCHDILTEWGIDPDERELAAAEAIRLEQRELRAVFRGPRMHRMRPGR
jgi:hypothetical protein